MNSYIPFYMRGENLDKNLDYDRTIALPPSELSDYFMGALSDAEIAIFHFDLNPEQIVEIYKSLSQIWNFREHYLIRIKELKLLFEWCLDQNIQDDDGSWKDFMGSIYVLYLQMCKAYHIQPRLKYQIPRDLYQSYDYDWERDPQRCRIYNARDGTSGRYIYDEI